MDQKGNTIVLVTVVGAISIGAFFFLFQRKDNLIKDISSTVLSYQQEAKVFEMRSLFTFPVICESSLKNLQLNQTHDIQLKSSPTQIIEINKTGDEVSVKKLRLLPGSPVTSEFADGNIEITLETKNPNKTLSEKITLIPFNFLIDTASNKILECLGEKTPESVELFNSTIAKKREEICVDALKGTIDSQGKCSWPW